MRQSEAKLLVRSEWSLWLRQHPEITAPNGNHSFAFYSHLVKTNALALRFHCRGDKWQTVHGWLLEMGMVTD